MDTNEGHVLGFDPGSRNSAYASMIHSNGIFYFNDIGDIELTDDEFGGRISKMAQRVSDLINKHNPSFICYESVLFGRNVTNALNTAKIIGAIEFAAYTQSVTSIGYPPQKIKKIITDNGRASKYEMKENVSKLIDANKSNEDEFWHTHASNHIIDACAIGIVGLQLYDRQNKE